MAPQPQPTPLPSPTVVERDSSITTISVYASDSSTPTASTSSSTSIPVAPIVGGLVGGILGGLLIAGIVYYCWNKKNRERDARHRAAVARRNRKRQAALAAQEAKSNQPSPAMRGDSSKSLISEKEKGYVSNLPAVPRAVYNPNKQEVGYGYNPSSTPLPPSVETPDYAQQYLAAVEDESEISAPNSYAPEPEVETTPSTASNSTSPPSKPSRSKARMAAAESAVANASADPVSRYRPNKPSPLALAAAAKAEEQRLKNGHDDNAQENLNDPGDSYQPNQSRVDKVSGEWGVALGSPNNDGNFSMQQQQIPQDSLNGQDPYLSAANYRGPSGHYSSDPYAAYHGGENEVDHQSDPGSAGVKKGGSWV